MQRARILYMVISFCLSRGVEKPSGNYCVQRYFLNIFHLKKLQFYLFVLSLPHQRFIFPTKFISTMLLKYIATFPFVLNVLNDIFINSNTQKYDSIYQLGDLVFSSFFLAFASRYFSSIRIFKSFECK